MTGAGPRYDLAPVAERFLLRRPGDAQASAGDAFEGLIFVEHWLEELTARVPSP